MKDLRPTADAPIRTIVREAEFRLEIKRSRFVARSFKRATPEAALAALKDVRDAHRDANHNVWAFRVGTTGEQARYSDDGEPGGTAGPPVLEVLKRSAATNVLLVVTRYFGGVKLGAGGLVRAYGEAAKSVLAASGLKEMRLMATLEAEVPYPLLPILESHAGREGVEILERRFGERVTVTVRLPASRTAEWRAYHAQLTGGKFGSRALAEDYD